MKIDAIAVAWLERLGLRPLEPQCAIAIFRSTMPMSHSVYRRNKLAADAVLLTLFVPSLGGHVLHN